MRNYISSISTAIASLFLLVCLYDLFLIHPDWAVLCACLGFCFVFLGFALLFEFLLDLEGQFIHLTKVLSDTFNQLSKMDHERPTSHVTVTFKNNDSLLWAQDAMDLMSLDELESERKKAEKEENYEKAAMIQKKIEQRKSKH